MAKTHTIKAVEIFAPGKWNGMSFDTKALEGLVEAFKALGSLIKVPLKLGHNDEQAVTDGQPALGWVEDIWVEAKGSDGKPKLMAKFTDMPTVLFDAINQKLFRKVSIELIMDAVHKGKTFDNVLTAVAILGADMPAVNTLADLTAFMSRKTIPSDVAFGRAANFTAIGADSTTQTGDPDMGELEELKARLAKSEAANETLTGDNAKFKVDNAKFKTEQEAAEVLAKSDKLKAHRAELVGILDKAVVDKKILPAQREVFAKTFALDDDVRVLSVDKAQVEALIDSTTQSFSKGGTVKNEGDSTDIGDEDPGTWLHTKTLETIGENPKLKYSQAQKIVFAANPKIAQQYQGFGGAE